MSDSASVVTVELRIEVSHDEHADSYVGWCPALGIYGIAETEAGAHEACARAVKLTLGYEYDRRINSMNYRLLK